MVALKAWGTMLWGVSGYHTQCLPTSSAANECVVSSVVPKVPAVRTLTPGTFDREVSFTLWCAGGVSVHSPSLCSYIAGKWGFPDGSWQSISLAGVVVSNEALGQCKPEVLDGKLVNVCACHWDEVLAKYKGIHHSAVKPKPKDVSVKLPGLASDPVVVSQLVRAVYSPHKLIVCYHTWWTWNWNSAAMSFFLCTCMSPCGLALVDIA